MAITRAQANYRCTHCDLYFTAAQAGQWQQCSPYHAHGHFFVRTKLDAAYNESDSTPSPPSAAACGPGPWTFKPIHTNPIIYIGDAGRVVPYGTWTRRASGAPGVPETPKNAPKKVKPSRDHGDAQVEDEDDAEDEDGHAADADGDPVGRLCQ